MCTKNMGDLPLAIAIISSMHLLNKLTWDMLFTKKGNTTFQEVQSAFAGAVLSWQKLLARYGWYSIIPPGTWEYDDISSHYSNILLKTMLCHVITMPSMCEASLNVFWYYKSTELK